MKKRFLVAGIVLTAIGLILCGIANFLVINALVERNTNGTASEQLGGAFAILISIIFSIPCYIGQLAFNVAGIATTAQTLGSESRAIKTTGIVFLVLNAVAIIFSIAMFVAFFAICNSQNPETASLMYKLLTLRV